MQSLLPLDPAKEPSRPEAHPLLYLRGVKFQDLQSVLNFMYHGEVNVAQEELNSFLAVAEELRVKGLTQNQSTKKQESSFPAPSPKLAPSRIPDREPPPPPKRPRPAPVLQSNQHSLPPPEDDDIQEVVPVKSEPREAPLVQQNQAQPAAQEMYSHALQAAEEGEYGGEEQYEDYGQYEGEGYDAQEGGDGNKGIATELDSAIDQYLVMGTEGSLQCIECGLSGKKRDVRRHIEAKHMANTHVSCSLCGKVVKTRDSLRKHMEKDHREWKT